MMLPKLVADLLCGAGGTSTAIMEAFQRLNIPIELVCLNHWQTAIDTHRINHPQARHYVQDIATARPHQIVPEGYLDFFAASPTCTHHSVARGGKPTSDQQRSDPWHIVTWLTELDVKRIAIENVWEFIGWGPVDPKTMRPIRERKGEYFHAWTEVLRKLGYELEWRRLNAADFGDATTRQRFIMLGRKDGKRLYFPAPTHARKPRSAELLPSLQPWRPAREIINWNRKGRSIFGRLKPLAPKTLDRILTGALRFNWPEPYIALLLPEIERSLRFALRFAFSRRHGGKAAMRAARRKAIRTYLSRLRNMPAHNKAIVARLAEQRGHASPMLLTLRNHADGRPVTAPIPAVAANGTHIGLVEPFILSRQSAGAPRATTQPVPTNTTVHTPILISPYYSSGSGETCINGEVEPLPSATTKGRFGMVVAVTNSNGGPGPRDIDVDPLPVMTTAKGGEFAIVMPVTHEGGINRVKDTGEPLDVITGANRGELAFVTAQFSERPDQAPRVHGLDEPATTGMTLGHGALVQPSGHDILFRMLEPDELAAAMGLSDGDRIYRFAGTKTEQVKQIGNAVAVKMMRACVMALMEDDAAIPDPIKLAAE